VAFEETSVSDMRKEVWETIPDSRPGKVDAALSDLSSSAQLDEGGCVGRSESRSTARLHNCVNAVGRVLWHPVGMHEHYKTPFT